MRSRTFRRDGKEYTIQKIVKLTGIGRSTAHTRLNKWERGLLSEADLLAPSRNGNGYKTPKEILESIPGPTPLERRIFG